MEQIINNKTCGCKEIRKKYNKHTFKTNSKLKDKVYFYKVTEVLAPICGRENFWRHKLL
jgi:hypothetical protein